MYIKKLFDTLTKSVKTHRYDELLCPPFRQDTKEWFMCVPRFFNYALDIQLTERQQYKKKYYKWTQGSLFSFSRGDTFYDSQDGYKPWDEALKKIFLCIQVEQARPVSFNPMGRDAGLITISFYAPNRERKKVIKVGNEVEMTHDDFVEFLIFGTIQTNHSVDDHQRELLVIVSKSKDS